MKHDGKGRGGEGGRLLAVFFCVFACPDMHHGLPDKRDEGRDMHREIWAVDISRDGDSMERMKRLMRRLMMMELEDLVVMRKSMRTGGCVEERGGEGWKRRSRRLSSVVILETIDTERRWESIGMSHAVYRVIDNRVGAWK